MPPNMDHFEDSYFIAEIAYFCEKVPLITAKSGLFSRNLSFISAINSQPCNAAPNKTTDKMKCAPRLSSPASSSASRRRRRRRRCRASGAETEAEMASSVCCRWAGVRSRERCWWGPFRSRGGRAHARRMHGAEHWRRDRGGSAEDLFDRRRAQSKWRGAGRWRRVWKVRCFSGRCRRRHGDRHLRGCPSG